jgi:hypothetical protein
VLSFLLALVAVGCAPLPHGEPLPGSFHMTSDPPLAPHPLSIRSDDIGGPSGRSAEFEAGDEVVVDWSTLPLPEVKWIEVNGRDCEGTFTIQERVEIDLMLILIDGACRIEVLGTHPEGGPHLVPGASPGLTVAGSP